MTDSTGHLFAALAADDKLINNLQNATISLALLP